MRTIAVERTIDVDRSPDEVFEFLRFLANSKHYNELVSNRIARSAIEGNDGSAGAVLVLKSSPNGTIPEQRHELCVVDEARRFIRIEAWIRKRKNVAANCFEVIPLEDGRARIEWSMEGKVQFPFGLFRRFLESSTAKMIETSLKRIQTHLAAGN